MSLFRLRRATKYPIAFDAPFQRLPELAYNLWWTWHAEAQNLFYDLDPEHWLRHRNPVKLLRERKGNLATLGKETPFVARYRNVMKDFDLDLETSKHWFARTYPRQKDTLIAYFSPEFGLHDCFPIYSGGLGVLAGDHVKTASDLGLPLVGVGLLYKNGYFTQRVDLRGLQQAVYPNLNFDELPVLPVFDANRRRLTVAVELAQRTVHAQVWLARVGSASMVLLDTDVASNTPKDRRLTSQLYGGDREMRIAQEIIMGIGGVRALRALGIAPTVWHLNEGHVAFLCFERMRELIQNEKLQFEQACEAVAMNTVFTTHTPVPAGNETFALSLMQKYFHAFWRKLNTDWAAVLDLGLQLDRGGWKYFSMTVMALRLSRASNGVSQLHGEVARRMWQHLWPGVPEHEIPITAITNGVHAETWASPQMAEIYDEYLGRDWRAQLASPPFWRQAGNIPNEILWQARLEAKMELIAFVRERLAGQYRRQGASATKINAARAVLDPMVLTIGFARRFATYKRADLIFRDLRRLERIVNHAQRPVQIIFAGKAHPRDLGGQQIVQRVFRMAQRKNLFGKIIFIEDYDMNVGRLLVQGVDVWLNNPRRPLEASGTSGQKVPLNGGLNLSILDGWWDEGYDGSNGWKLGKPNEYADEAVQDAEDAAHLYRVLEREVIPLYYQRDRRGIPQRWLQKAKVSTASLVPQFNTRAMVQAYIERLYVPAAQYGRASSHKALKFATALSMCKSLLRAHWPLLHFIAVEKRRRPNNQIEILASVYLGELDPEWVEVECVQSDRPALTLRSSNSKEQGVYAYRVNLTGATGRAGDLRLRIIPNPTLFMQPHETGLIAWSQAI
ncbi:MAG: alpha-glucan family phosphorylase [bacterium]